MSTDALESSCTAQSRRGLRRFFIAAIRFEPALTRNTGNIMDETVRAPNGAVISAIPQS